MASRNELVEKVIEKAWRDEAFKAQLLKDPAAALQQLNIPIPPGANVQVHEENANTLHLVIPQDPAKTQLSDQDLDAVSGGGTLDSWGPPFC